MEGGSDEEAFEQRVVRGVARLERGGLHERDPELWGRLQRDLGRDCRSLWEAMCARTRERVATLLECGDAPALPPVASRMTLTDWLLLDSVLVHRDVDVISSKSLRSHDELRPLVQVFHLVQQFGLERCPRARRAAAWAAATASYNRQGKHSSPMLLQRRWWELKRTTQEHMCRYWRQLRSAHARPQMVSPPQLHTAIARRFPHVVTEPQRSWAASVESGDVILADEFERLTEEEVSAAAAAAENVSSGGDEDERASGAALPTAPGAAPAALAVPLWVDVRAAQAPAGAAGALRKERAVERHASPGGLVYDPALSAYVRLAGGALPAGAAGAGPAAAPRTELRALHPDLDPRLPALSPAFFASPRNRRLLHACVPLTVRLERLAGVAEAAEAAARRGRRVRLPDMAAVRRDHRAVPHAQVSPRPRAPPPRACLTPLALRRVLADLKSRVRPLPVAHYQVKYCCAAKRHRVLNDARMRISLRRPKRREPGPLRLHAHEGGRRCECCCRHLLSDAERGEVGEGGEGQPASSSAAAGTAPPAAGRKPNRARRTRTKHTDKINEEEPTQPEGYELWQRERQAIARFGFKVKPLSARVAPGAAFPRAAAAAPPASPPAPPASPPARPQMLTVRIRPAAASRPASVQILLPGYPSAAPPAPPLLFSAPHQRPPARLNSLPPPPARRRDSSGSEAELVIAEGGSALEDISLHEHYTTDIVIDSSEEDAPSPAGAAQAQVVLLDSEDEG